MNTIPRYIYIDDEEKEAIQSIINGLNDTKHIDVTYFPISHHKTFESLVSEIKKEFENGCDGVLLDLCLNGGGINSLQFSASTVAQYLRSSASSKILPDFPIVLCSTDEKLRNSYIADTASHDLYDYKFVKGSGIIWDTVALRMQSLSQGYQCINNRNIYEILNLTESQFEKIDQHIFDRFRFNEVWTSYDLAHFILNDLFAYSGALISEEIVASRFGIDIQYSKEEWIKLIDIINAQAKYNGVFADGWIYYWADEINSFFKSISMGKSWTSFNARDRVKIINSKYSLNLIDANPIEFATSSYFDTVCEGTKRPLDSMEGFEIYESADLKPWQEPKYVSVYALCSGKYPNIRIKNSEKKRFEEIKACLRNETKGN